MALTIPSNTPRITLLTLPPEIRNHIYAAALHSTPLKDFLLEGQGWKSSAHRLRFLLTCRQIYEEAGYLAFAETLFPIYAEKEAMGDYFTFKMGDRVRHLSQRRRDAIRQIAARIPKYSCSKMWTLIGHCDFGEAFKSTNTFSKLETFCILSNYGGADAGALCVMRTVVFLCRAVETLRNVCYLESANAKSNQAKDPRHWRSQVNLSGADLRRDFDNYLTIGPDSVRDPCVFHHNEEYDFGQGVSLVKPFGGHYTAELLVLSGMKYCDFSEHLPLKAPRTVKLAFLTFGEAEKLGFDAVAELTRRR